MTKQFHTSVFTQEEQNHMSPENLRKNIYSALFILAKTQTSNNKRVTKRFVVYVYNGFQLSNKAGWTTDTHNHVDESRKHYVKWQKSDISKYITQRSISMKT